MRPGRMLLALVSLALALACGTAATSGCGGPQTVAGDAGTDVRIEASPADRFVPPDRDASEAAVGREAGLPFLVALAVIGTPGGDASAPIALTPAFASDVHDYYVRCGAGSNALVVSMTASLDATSSLTAPVKSPSARSQTLMVNVLENQAVVAVAKNSVGTAEYWVRCLPHDMPAMTWDEHAEAGTRSPGYYLLGNFFSGPAEAAYAMVLDTHGVPVWYTKAPGGATGADDVDSLQPGTISYDPFHGGFTTTGFLLHTLSPPSTTPLQPTGYVPTLHELRFLSDGNYMVIAPQSRVADFTGRSLQLPDGGTTPLGVETMLDCAILEFTPAGDVVWTWLAGDHFGIDALTELQPAFGTVPGPDGGILIDGFHCNSIDVETPSGDLLVSGRDMDSVFLVERATGKVLWKMGGVPSNKDGAGYVTVSDPYFRQHDARLQRGWSHTCTGYKGQISVFDDESYVAGAVARAVVYDVEVGMPGDGGCPDGGTLDGAALEAGPADGAAGDAAPPDGGVVGTATVAWSYKGLASATLTGSFRIAEDGSRVIDWGLGGKPKLVFTEVDFAKHDLLDFSFGRSDASYRTIKLPVSAFDLDVLRQTAGSP